MGEALFWTSVTLLAFGYLGFPLLVVAVGLLRRQRVRQAAIEPRVTLLIAAYNEEQEIADRLENALALDYPSNALEIIVASDGSTDNTEAIVRRFAPRGVRLLALPRRGKVHALDAAALHAQGDILVFSDANTRLLPDALRALVRNFADPEVGGVAGDTQYTIAPDSESSSLGESLYWRYDRWLKHMESLSGSVVSAHGGLYAIRRDLFRPIPDAGVTDDFAISTGVVQQGYRLVFEPSARGYEVAVPRANREFRRRVRLMTRGLRSVLLRRRLLNPFRYGFYAVVLFCHKVLRRLLPIALVTLLASSVVLLGEGWPYRLVAAVQGLGLCLAALGYALRSSSIGRAKIFYVPFFFCMANAASVLALLGLVRGVRIEVWEPQRHGALS